MAFICYNGKILDAAMPVLYADNRCFKYGDGVFETMRLQNGKVLLENYHYDRLLNSLKLLQIECTPALQMSISKNILEICEKNKCSAAARVRLSVFRDTNNSAAYLIETELLKDDFYKWNEEGWRIEIYPFAQKSCDALSNLKTASRLPYVLAEFYAKEKEVEECLVLNSNNSIADGSRTNIFLIMGKDVMTPGLDQGCVAGVMRRHLINELNKEGFTVQQTALTVNLLHEADEVFLTNAVQGIKWVKAFKEKEFKNAITKEIFDKTFGDHSLE